MFALLAGLGCFIAVGILREAIPIVRYISEGEFDGRLLERVFGLSLGLLILFVALMIPRSSRRMLGTGMDFRDLQRSADDGGFGTGARDEYLGEPIAASPAWLVHGFSMLHGYTPGVLYLGERLLFVAPDGEVILDFSREEAHRLQFRWGELILERGGRSYRTSFTAPGTRSLLFAGVRCYWRWKRLLREWARGEQPEIG